MKKEQCLKNIRKFVDSLTYFDLPIHAFSELDGSGIILRDGFGWQFNNGKDSFTPNDEFINESLWNKRIELCERYGIKQEHLLHGEVENIRADLIKRCGKNNTEELFK